MAHRKVSRNPAIILAIEQPDSPQRVSTWRQRFKWTVYALLFIDFILYLYQDFESAHYTLDERSSLLEVLAAYVTSIDLVAWFALILLFELETYVLVGRGWTGATKWVVQGVRLICYVTILHTSFSYDIALREFQDPERLPVAADVCGYTEGWSFLRNRDYLEIDAGNCATIGKGPEFFAISDDAVVTDRAGLEEGLILAWTDLIESRLVAAYRVRDGNRGAAETDGLRERRIAARDRAHQVCALCRDPGDRCVLGLEGPAPLLVG